MFAKLLAPFALATLFVGLAGPAQASEIIAKYTIDAGADAQHPALADLALDADGRLSVQKTAYDLSQGEPLATSEQTVTTELDPVTLQTVLRQVTMLSGTEVETTHATVLCMMLPAFGQGRHVLQVRSGYDWETKGFTGDLVTIDNNAGCWQSLHIQPKDDADRTTAKVLEGELQVIALTALSHG